MVNATTAAAALTHPVSGGGEGRREEPLSGCAPPHPSRMGWLLLWRVSTSPLPRALPWSWGDVLVAAQPESTVCAALVCGPSRLTRSGRSGVGGGQTTCPETVLDLKNIEYSASINYHAVTIANGPPPSREHDMAPSWGQDVGCKCLSFTKL